MIPNAQNTLLQSRLINSPPVKGMIKADDVDDCGRLEPEFEVEDAVEDEEDEGWVTRATWTKNLLVELLLCLSCAVQVICVLPTGKSDPEAGTQEATPAPSTMSEVAGLV